MEKNIKKNEAVQGAPVEAGKIVEMGKNLPVAHIKAMTLPQTIKTVETLFKKIQHRDRLEAYAQQLQGFEIKKVDEDLEPTNYYAGCKLEITDDANGKFTIKHPVIIKEVIDFVRDRFIVRLAEIEAEIFLPTKAA